VNGARTGRAALVALGLLLLAGALAGGAHWVARREWRASEPTPPVPAEAGTGAVLLRELVSREAGLRHGLSPWEATSRIRDWAHANTDIATAHYLLDEEPAFQYYRRDAPEIFAAFFEDRGGVWCGGAAHALQQLYRLFGFRASTVDFGAPGVFTHVVTLVTVRVGGVERVVVQDPHLNLTYVRQSRQPYDYFDLLGTLAAGEHEAVHPVRGRRTDREVLVHPQDDEAGFLHTVDFRDRPLRTLPNGVRKYRSRLSPGTVETAFGPRVRAFLSAQGRPADMAYLLLYPLGGSDPSVIEAARSVVQQRPVGSPASSPGGR
jgi:hypothetical protein